MSIPQHVAYNLFLKYCKEHYGRIYRVTLAPTEENIKRAYAVYVNGIINKAGIVESIIAIYGYRYRRMENFLKELRIWIPREGWVCPRVLVKVTVSYTASKKKSSNIEMEAELVSIYPFMEFVVNTPLVMNYVIECLEFNNIYGVEEIIGDARIEAQFLNEYDVWKLTETVDVEVSFTVSFSRKYTYSYEGSCVFTVEAFILGGLVVKAS